MTYCKKQVLLFTFYLIFLETSAGPKSTVTPTGCDQKLDINLDIIAKESNLDEQEGNESERDYEGFLSGSLQKQHKKPNPVEIKGPKLWDQWGKWSTCSVTCGVGKITRWRHCVSGGCADGEKEAQIKTCTLPCC